MLNMQSLGNVAATGNGILCTGSTNATPIVLTVNAGHGLKVGDYIAVTGITGNTGANGEWRLSAVAATTATLEGSVGNGTHGGTPVVSVIMADTPHLPKHAAVALIADGTATLVGTVLVEGSDDNSAFVDVKKGVALAANPGSVSFEVELKKYMRVRASAFTSGSVSCQLLS